jgi:hypothetical protein
MLLRVIIGLGVLMMLAGFGAAGLQYWQSLPPSATTAEAGLPDQGAAPSRSQQNWLISPTGGLMPRDKVRAYLEQARFVDTRFAVITQTAPLDALLLEGEKLPEPAYLQVLADIRAPDVASDACATLLDTIAVDCAVHAARVVDGSIDAVAGTGRFRIELAFRLKPSEADLPDLAATALVTEYASLAAEVGSEAAASVDALMRAAINAADETCAAIRRAEACRILRLDVDLQTDGNGAARAEVAALTPLPKGMYPAPPLP